MYVCSICRRVIYFQFAFFCSEISVWIVLFLISPLFIYTGFYLPYLKIYINTVFAEMHKENVGHWLRELQMYLFMPPCFYSAALITSGLNLKWRPYWKLAGRRLAAATRRDRRSHLRWQHEHSSRPVPHHCLSKSHVLHHLQCSACIR